MEQRSNSVCRSLSSISCRPSGRGNRVKRCVLYINIYSFTAYTVSTGVTIALRSSKRERHAVLRSSNLRRRAAAVSQRRHNSRPRNTNLSRGREGGELYSRPCARHGTVLIHPGALSRRKKPYGYKCVAIYSGRVLAGKTLATEKTTTRRDTPEKNDRL